MGWQDRDWAKLRDDELAAIYGFRAPPSGSKVSTRMVVWPVVGIVVTAFFTFAFMHRETAPTAPAPADAAPSALYGSVMQGTAFGSGAVCEEYEYVVGSGWRCDDIVLNTRNVPVIRPTPYAGQCAHLKVADTAWVCAAPTPTAAPSS